MSVLPPRRGAAASLVLALVLAGCLPAGVRPSGAPASAGPAGSGVPSGEPGSNPPTTPVPATAPTPHRPSPSPAPTFMLYTVVHGDTLVGIARRFGTSGRSIAYWNRDRYPSLDPESESYAPDGIRAGWVLALIPNREYVPPAGEGESGEEVTPRPSEDDLYETLPPEEETSPAG